MPNGRSGVTHRTVHRARRASRRRLNEQQALAPHAGDGADTLTAEGMPILLMAAFADQLRIRIRPAVEQRRPIRFVGLFSPLRAGR